MTNVLLLYRDETPSMRLCVYEQAKELARQNILGFRSKKLSRVSSDDFEWCHVAIFVRGDSLMEEKLAKRLKKTGVYLIYIMDDDLLNVPEYVGSALHYNKPKTIKRIENIMSYCDCLLSPSSRLIEKYGSRFAKSALIEEVALGKPPGENFRKKGPVRVGFAGSFDRVNDIENIISDAIRRLKDRYGERVEFEFFGVKPKVVQDLGLKYFPFCYSYDQYVEVMKERQWDVGLAPMPDSTFHRYKHYNKFIEYSGYGIAGVYSNVEPYKNIIRNGENGLLCENTTDAWEEALSILINNGELREKIAEKAWEEASAVLSKEATAKKMKEALGEVLTCSQENIKRSGTRFSKAEYIVLRAVDVLDRHRLGIFKVVFHKIRFRLSS